MNGSGGSRFEDFDPDTPTEAVGTLRPIDLDALGLSRLGLVFVAVAIVVGLLRLSVIGGVGSSVLPNLLLRTIEAVAVCLLPAALLLRDPAAERTHPVLLAGLAAGAGAEAVRAIVARAPLALDLMTAWSGSLVTLASLADLAGAVLVGLGLMRLLPVPTRRQLLLVGIAGAYLLLAYASPVMLAASGVDIASDRWALVQPAGYALASAFVTWVAVAAWQDRADPRTFWALLAAALPLGVAARLTEVAGTFVNLGPTSQGTRIGVLTLLALFGAATACLALVAYWRYAPAPGDGATGPG